MTAIRRTLELNARVGSGQDGVSRIGLVNAGAQSRRRQSRSRVFRLIGFGFTAFSVVTVVMLFVWPYLSPSDDRMRVAATLPELAFGENSDAMLGTTYQGVDQLGRPFLIKAELVRSLDGEKKEMELTEPRLRMSLEDGRPVTMLANRGIYMQREQALDFTGDVHFILDNTYQVDTSQATLQLETATASGHEDVVARGPFGHLTAEGFRMSDGGQTINFLGRSRLIVDQQALAEPS